MANGRIFREDEELFAEESWIQVFLGQGFVPRGYDPLADLKSHEEVARYLHDVRSVIRKCADLMPAHSDYIARVCPAP